MEISCPLLQPYDHRAFDLRTTAYPVALPKLIKLGYQAEPSVISLKIKWTMLGVLMSSQRPQFAMYTEHRITHHFK